MGLLVLAVLDENRSQTQDSAHHVDFGLLVGVDRLLFVVGNFVVENGEAIQNKRTERVEQCRVGGLVGEQLVDELVDVLDDILLVEILAHLKKQRE